MIGSGTIDVIDDPFGDTKTEMGVPLFQSGPHSKDCTLYPLLSLVGEILTRGEPVLKRRAKIDFAGVEDVGAIKNLVTYGDRGLIDVHRSEEKEIGRPSHGFGHCHV